MDRPNYLSEDDDLEGAVKAERIKMPHAKSNAAQTPSSPSVSSVSGSGRRFSGGGSKEWPQPKPLPNGLAPVEPFDIALLPETIAPWVADIAERMQCPPDFVAVPAMVALGAVIGRKTGIRPQRQTDWTEVANLWGCTIGRPGMMKTPATQEALKPLHRLEATARDAHADAGRAYARELELFKLASDEARNAARTAMKRGTPAYLPELEAPQEPKARRYVINDTTYEALGVILADNPNGVLAHRDELVSLLKTLDREEYVAARGFFMSAWSGTQGYTFDRIIRGKTHIEAACLSLLGSTQPGRIAEYVRMANRGGLGDDVSASVCSSGLTKAANGRNATAGPTVLRARRRGPPSSASTSSTRTQSAPSAINTSRSRSCALTKRLKTALPSGGPTLKSAFAPTTFRPPSKATSQSIAHSSRRSRLFPI
jgi:Protein of unknown function (DUF3987)